MSARGEMYLWTLQRASAAVLAAAVMVHLATIIVAVQGGLSAGEIVARLHGNGGWLAFYLVFAAAAAVHAPIGLRNVLREWSPLPRPAIDAACGIAGVAMLMLGARAAFAMFHGPG